jgi:hypothetical protein
VRILLDLCRRTSGLLAHPVRQDLQILRQSGSPLAQLGTQALGKGFHLGDDVADLILALLGGHWLLLFRFV